MAQSIPSADQERNSLASSAATAAFFELFIQNETLSQIKFPEIGLMERAKENLINFI
jgi:hypothetical protein